MSLSCRYPAPFAVLFVPQNGTDVRSLMPVPDTVASRKKKLWKTVFEGFDKVDGVPSPAEREVSYENGVDNHREKTVHRCVVKDPGSP